MNDTPNQTAESVIAEAMVNAGAPLMHSRVEESVAAALRRFGLLSEGTPSEAQVEAAARAFFREYHGEDIWPELRDDGELDTRSRALAATRVALTAAGVAPQAEIDERIQAWERLIQHPVWRSCFEEERPLIDSVMERIDKLAELEMTVNELAPALVLPSSGVDEDVRSLSAWPTVDEVRETFKKSADRLAFDRMIASVERAAAEKALTEAANELALLDDGGKRGMAGHSKSSASAITHRHSVAVIRARAEAYTEGKLT